MINKGHGVLVPAYRSRAGYHAMVVAGFAIISTAALSIGDTTTREVIAHNEAEDLKATLTQIIAPDSHDNNLLEGQLSISDEQGKPHEVYRALKNGQVQAVAFRTEETGYSGLIKVMMAVDKDGKILGARVLSHTETPGLGDRIEVEKADWILGFNGKSLGDPPLEKWAVKKDGGIFDQFTGATITPRRTTRAILDGMQFFNSHKAALLAAPPANTESASSAGGQS